MAQIIHVSQFSLRAKDSIIKESKITIKGLAYQFMFIAHAAGLSQKKTRNFLLMIDGLL